jgi:hypothetical protein
MKENIFWVVFVVYILWSYYKNNRSNLQIKSLKKVNQDLVNENKELIKKSRIGDFFVRLEKVPLEKKSILATIISIQLDISRDNAASIVNRSCQGSLPIIVENVSEEYANDIKGGIENHGGTVFVGKK